MTKKLDAICIPSGPNPKIDFIRGITAINYHYTKEKAPFIIMGLGPDTNSALGYLESMENPDYHKRLHNLLLDTTDEKIGVDINSRTTIENVIYCLGQGLEGIHGISTDPWHYKKFELIVKKLKKKGIISKNIEIFNIPAPDTHYYSRKKKILSNIKTRLELMRI